MEKQKLSTLFSPKSVAIVGASDKEGKVGTAITENVMKLGYEGKVFLVNPSYESLHGQKCYKSLIEIEDGVDVAVVVVPAKFVLDVVRQSADKVKNFVIISAGFSEIGKDGVQREGELALLAKQKGLNVLGPNCLGFINPKINLNASFAAGMPEKGNIAFVSQSGALLVAALDIAKKEGLKFSSLFSVGNKMQMSEIELMEELGNDKDTKIIGMYLEGINDGKAFIETASRVSQKKPIVILKAGKTEKSQKAISSHTGALSGSDEIMDAVFEKTGVIRANNLEDFFEMLEIISSSAAPQNEKVAVITNAGGAGVLATDAFKGRSVKLADFSDKVKGELGKNLPEEGSVENPIDVLGDAAEDRYAHALETIAKEDIGTTLCILTPQEKTPVGKIAEVIIDFKKKTDKVVAAAFIGGGLVEEAVSKMKEAGIPTFAFPERAVGILDQYYKWSQRKGSEKRLKGKEDCSERKGIVAGIINHAKEEGKKALRFDDAAKIMALYGINAIESHYFKQGEEVPEGMKYPVVAKIDSDRILHKTDQKALVLGIKNSQELSDALEDLWNRFPGEEILVQPMLSKGTELILGINRDEVFGSIVVAGLGGIYTEIFKMVDFFVPPMNHEDIVG
ncbi:MAG: putative acetyl-CoA synthetase (ADP-forming) protein, partial [Candidatus Moranbacteria bacterium GW2011_GWE2_47_10]